MKHKPIQPIITNAIFKAGQIIGESVCPQMTALIVAVNGGETVCRVEQMRLEVACDLLRRKKDA